ncbi:MAG: hypothetical protein A3J58_00965 [Candidatus Sungbacteria bacterium RIFCSPHIGHO2_02_FULL_52_23]|uniref:Nudix hydrolase domain-containing protein n=1 Tax=Candidatus Sungbacteria bacterium RIFCSPHIGHO2_02_FULL_52_23 TaxID=1802274 RepID=A0A1G2KXT7_9BACT|nr:MAG: hypothetical protein A3J58_00965 [Candidatus Sungbacteria bacterium RIFCSPHIGHO2_02_FULL_52_23]
MKRDFGLYHVGLKILLHKDGYYLILRKKNGHVDLPGGRIDNVEYATPLERVLAREIREELGQVKYALGHPLFHYRADVKSRGVYVFVAVFAAEYLSGAVRISSEHRSYQWVKIGAFPFTRRDFRGEEIYRAFKKNLEHIRKPAFEPRVPILRREASRKPKNIRDILRLRRIFAAQNRNSQSRNGVSGYALKEDQHYA